MPSLLHERIPADEPRRFGEFCFNVRSESDPFWSLQNYVATPALAVLNASATTTVNQVPEPQQSSPNLSEVLRDKQNRS